LQQTDSNFNYSYSIRIRPNSSINYSYSAEYYTPTIRYSPNFFYMLYDFFVTPNQNYTPTNNCIESHPINDNNALHNYEHKSHCTRKYFYPKTSYSSWQCEICYLIYKIIRLWFSIRF